MKYYLILAIIFFTNAGLRAAEYQWSVNVAPGATDVDAKGNLTPKERRAFLWIPADCRKVRAVVLGQHNMLEEGILEHPKMRAELAKLGIAEVWVAPPFDGKFDFYKDACQRFEAFMKTLASESGYDELATAPVIPIGHSACATFPWNFGAWNPERTLAIISCKGDAPQTTMTGYGGPNVPWGPKNNIDGVPGLMVMGEYEWVEDRILPALGFQLAHPAAPIAMLADPGHGHFDASDELVEFLALFIRKAAEYRLSNEELSGGTQRLKPIDPKQGWLVQRWFPNQKRTIPPAAADKYTGDPHEAFWAFDEEMARAIQNFGENQIEKAPQLLGYIQEGKTVPQTKTHNQVSLKFEPEADGMTFRIGATFLEQVDGGSPNLPRWTGQPAGSPIGHASGGGPIHLQRITGPFEQITADTFRVQLNRTASTTDRRNNEVWLLAYHPGDGTYKSAVQQSLMKLKENTEGTPQTITFPEIPDQKAGTVMLELKANGDSDLSVSYYVREGPAKVEGNKLLLTAIPPRAKYPVKVTVIAWQFGRASEPKIKTATPVERTFNIVSGK